MWHSPVWTAATALRMIRARSASLGGPLGSCSAEYAAAASWRAASLPIPLRTALRAHAAS